MPHDQLAVGGEQRRLLAGRAAVLIKRSVERVENEAVAVVRDDGRRLQHQRRGGKIDVDVGESARALIGVRGIRRDQGDIPLLIGQGKIVKGQDAVAAGAVDEFPVGVRVACHGIGQQMLARIDDLVHSPSSFL